MAKLYYQGHGSYRIAANDGTVIYVDPFAGDGYDVPADLILVTHQHGDHNKVEKPARKPGCRLITNEEALAGGKHNSFAVGDIGIESTLAKNFNHSPKKCVGYIISVDGIQIYASGDTSKTEEMESYKDRQFDYAILPGDGFFNMSLNEAAECAELIGAKHNIPVHLKPGKLYDKAKAEKRAAPNKLIVEPGQEIEL